MVLYGLLDNSRFITCSLSLKPFLMGKYSVVEFYIEHLWVPQERQKKLHHVFVVQTDLESQFRILQECSCSELVVQTSCEIMTTWRIYIGLEVFFCQVLEQFPEVLLKTGSRNHCSNCQNTSGWSSIHNESCFSASLTIFLLCNWCLEAGVMVFTEMKWIVGEMHGTEVWVVKISACVR